MCILTTNRFNRNDTLLIRLDIARVDDDAPTDATRTTTNDDDDAFG